MDNEERVVVIRTPEPPLDLPLDKADAQAGLQPCCSHVTKSEFSHAKAQIIYNNNYLFLWIIKSSKIFVIP